MMKNILKTFTVFAALCILLVGTAWGKSVYLAANHHTSQFDAWGINPDGTVNYQATYSLQYAKEPAGIAIDAIGSNPLMFVSTEGIGGIEVINPVTLELYGVAPGPVNMGGVDVDDEDNILFAIQRGESSYGGMGTSNLYIYTYNDDGTGITQLANITLPNHGYGMSLAFDDHRDILWVTDIPNKMVKAYNTSDLNNITEIPSLSFSVSHPPIDVAVDSARNLVYTVAGWAGSFLITRQDISTGVETIIDIGHGAIGIAVDETTGYVYITGGGSYGNYSKDNLEVWNCNVSPAIMLQATADLGNPAGLAIANVSYNPLNLAKNDNIQGGGVSVGSTFTYDISFDSPSSDLTGVIITDTLPAELDFISANEGGVYDSVTHTVVWDIGAVSAGDTIPTFTLEVQVNSAAVPGNVIHNYCELDCDQLPPTSVIEGEDEEPGTPVLDTMPVYIDIKPESCPNPLNIKSGGVVSIAILGTEDFDVTSIDPCSIRIGTVPPISSSYEDVATPFEGDLCDCHDLGGDGYMDLTLKFDKKDLVKELNLKAKELAGETIPLTLTGLAGDIPIIGSDCVWILDK